MARMAKATQSALRRAKRVKTEGFMENRIEGFCARFLGERFALNFRGEGAVGVVLEREDLRR